MALETLYKDALEPVKDSHTLSAVSFNVPWANTTESSLILTKTAFISGNVVAGYVQTVGGLSLLGAHADSINQLRSENEMLREKLRSLENRLSVVEAHIPKEKIIVLRDVSYADAKKEITRLFLKGQALYYSDISQELGINLHTVVEICNELRKNGEIEIDG